MSGASTKPFDFSKSLEATWDMLWRLLLRGVADRQAPERCPTLATVGLDGTPQLRTVVLRVADHSDGLLFVHTDLRSAKISELRNEPRCSLHVWNPQQQLQLRIAAVAEIQDGGEVETNWRSVPEGSRSAYGGMPWPGSTIETPDSFEANVDRSWFAVVRLRLYSIETLCLTPDRHYRARYLKTENWSGQWLAP